MCGYSLASLARLIRLDINRRGNNRRVLELLEVINFEATVYAEELWRTARRAGEHRGDRRHLRGRSGKGAERFEIIGRDKNVMALRDASGFDVLVTATYEKITETRTPAIDAARLARDEADDELPVETIDLHSR